MNKAQAEKLAESIHEMTDAEFVDAYVHCHQTVKGLEEKMKVLRSHALNSLTGRIDGEPLAGNKGEISLQDGRKTFDSKSFREEYPDLWEKFQVTGNPFPKVKVYK